MKITDTSLILRFRWQLLAALLAAVAADTILPVPVSVAEKTFRQAQANLDQARSLLRRNQILFENGVIDETALAESRQTIAVADVLVKLAHQQLETARPVGSASIPMDLVAGGAS
jgi:multidrug resistance efflux pump